MNDLKRKDTGLFYLQAKLHIFKKKSERFKLTKLHVFNRFELVFSLISNMNNMIAQFSDSNECDSIPVVVTTPLHVSLSLFPTLK